MTKPKHESTGTYTDCWPYLDAAIQHGGLRIQFDTGRQAYSFRHRLYRARALLKGSSPSESGPYDHLILRLDPDKPAASESAAIVIAERTRPSATVTDLDGHPVEVGEDRSDLLEQAVALRQSLGLTDE